MGFGAGGANDLLSRITAESLTRSLGQTVIVENRPGAGGNVAAMAVIQSPPDGYTLLMAPTTTMMIVPAIDSKAPFDPVEQFTHIIQLSSFPLYLAVSASNPARTVKDLADFGNANPDKANYASSATTFQLISELFNTHAGTKYVRVPYKSGQEMTAALLAGHVTIVFNEPAAMMSFVSDGKIRLIGMTGKKRSADFPDVPTMAELGYPGVQLEAISAIVGPKGIPPEITRRLHADIDAALKTPEVRKRFQSLGVTPAGGPVEPFSASLAGEIKRIREFAAKANIRLE